jgi:hypothetical protein
MADQESDRLAELQKQLDEVQSKQEDLKQQLDDMPSAADGSTALPGDGRLASQATPEEIERARVLRDPWAGSNAMEILCNPPGKVLRWINPISRAGRGMRGWTAVRYDDPIGREIDKYIKEPPNRMVGLAEISEVVRRGDMVLAWIDEGIQLARRDAIFSKNHRATLAAADHGQREFKGGRSIGGGLRDDPDHGYRERPRRGMVSQQRLNDYRSRARGDARNPDDKQIRVTGRRLFDDPAPQKE